jgi:branched-chain amino acid transport system permease protein
MHILVQFFVNSVIAGSIYALVALGFAVIYRTVRFFHFAHGVVYTAGAYAAYALAVLLGWAIVPAFFAIVVTAALGVAIDRLVYLPLRRRKAPGLVLLLASFGVFIFLQNLIQLLFGAQVLSLRTGPVREGHHVLGAVITNIQITILAVCAALSVLLWLFLKFTKLGKAMRAVADDRLAASLVGIYSERVIMIAFAIGSALAGAAGILISYETNLEPTMGMNAILKGITAAIVGGIGSIPGALYGGLFVGLAENLGVWKIPTGWKDCIAFAILILFLLLRPQGILGKTSTRE